jgi:hypothetical protein
MKASLLKAPSLLILFLAGLVAVGGLAGFSLYLHMGGAFRAPAALSVLPVFCASIALFISSITFLIQRAAMPKRTAMVLLGVIIAGFSATALFAAHIWLPRVVARAVTPNGMELYIVQQPDGAWFTTSFVYHKPGAEWRRVLCDHEADYWGNMRVRFDPSAHVVVFYHGGSPEVAFSWDTESCGSIDSNGVFTAYRHLPPWRMPASWTPRMSVHSGETLVSR